MNGVLNNVAFVIHKCENDDDDQCALCRVCECNLLLLLLLTIHSYLVIQVALFAAMHCV